MKRSASAAGPHRVSPGALLRHGALDFLTAAALPVIWLLRDCFDYDTLRSLLFWPVVFELYVVFALVLAGMLATIRSGVLRALWFAAVAAGCLGGAWLSGAIAGQPWAWLGAVWLLAARLPPPPGTRWASAAHLQWLWTGAGYSGLLWGACFVAMILLMLGVPAPATRGGDGVLHSATPAWIFPLVWTPYFLAEAYVRAWRLARR